MARNQPKDRSGYIRNLYKLLGEIKRSRGKKHEDRFIKAMEEGTNFPSWYRGVRKATRAQDRRQIDAICDTDVGEIYIQIKSSHSGRIKFEEKHGRSGIVCVVVNETISEDTIREKTLFFVKQKRSMKLFLNNK